MSSLLGRLSYANVVSTLCLFFVLGGAAYAATNLPRNSVGTRQLKPGAVTAAKIKDGTITGAKVDSSTLGTVPAAISADRATSAARATNAANATNADRATSAATATRATTAASADRATSAASADRAAEATHADRATTADNAELLGGVSASGFVNSSQVGFIDQTFPACTLSVPCAKRPMTIAGVIFESGCEYSAGIAVSFFRVIPGPESRTGYSYVRAGNQASNGFWEGTNNVAPALSTGTEAVGATGLIVVRTPARIISLNFETTARLPSAGTATCTVAATALAV